MGEHIDRLMTQQQVVEWTGMSKQYFEISRFKGVGIPYVKIGRSVRYKTSDVQQWIEANVVATGI
jgi:predicted DNA-binding transcriptional regulator AlpA